MNSVEQMRQAALRYQARTPAREDKKAKLEEGKVLEANSTEQITARLNRLERTMPGIVTPSPEVALESLVSIDGAAPAPPPTFGVALERIIRGNDLKGVNYLELGLRLAGTVGRIHVRTSQGQTIGFGTGFMVSPHLMLTNNHVLESPDSAARSVVEFNYQFDINGEMVSSVFFDLQPEVFFLTDQHLDYALVAVKETASDGQTLRRFGWNRLIAETGKVLVGNNLSIIQHPRGDPKEVAIRDNLLVDMFDDFLHYETDTEQGSSGSPVFNDQWEVTALHHTGVPQVNAEGQVLTKDGTVWTEDMGDDAIDWIANEGVRISKIAEHINSQSLTDEQKQLVSEMLQEDARPFVLAGALQFDTLEVAAQSTPQPPAPPPPPQALQQVSSQQASSPQQASAVPMASISDSSITWTIPIQITVRLGQPIQVDAAAQDSTTPPTLHTLSSISTGGTTVVSPVSGSSGSSGNADMDEAFTELERARTRPYYDENADRQARDAYYNGIPDNLSPAARFDRLRDLLKATHKNKPSYQPAKHVYPWVDLHPDLKIHSIYSGDAFEPAQFIREDFEVEQEIMRLRERMLAAQNVDRARAMEALAFFEAGMPFNCEHVVPQSYFNKVEPMRGDMHHLFACEKDCNSFRSNIPYFDFTDFLEAVRSKCGMRKENKFEPEAGKGAVARATLYFLMRYPGEINNTAKEYTEDRLATLLKWHRDAPPDLYEHHRNQAIFEKQGNRNPLIDFPELAEKIDFKRGLG
jgi:endonuclease I/V8-like Glu-specific endopeptidase